MADDLMGRASQEEPVTFDQAVSNLAQSYKLEKVMTNWFEEFEKVYPGLLDFSLPAHAQMGFLLGWIHALSGGALQLHTISGKPYVEWSGIQKATGYPDWESIEVELYDRPHIGKNVQLLGNSHKLIRLDALPMFLGLIPERLVPEAQREALDSLRRMAAVILDEVVESNENLKRLQDELFRE
jgi:hypothetical protein